MDLDAYVAEHSAEWRRLDQLARRRRVTAAEADELVALYQRAATHLSVVRSRSPDPALVARLSGLVLAARNAITGAPAFSWSTVGRFFTATFPLAVYRAWPWWSAVATSFSILTFAIMAYVVAHPEVANLFMDDAAITRMVQSDFVGYYSEFQSQNSTLRVWTNNAVLTAECLAGGVLLMPVLVVLFYNAFNVGLSGGVMIAYGRGDVFFGMIIPHGLLELTAVFVGAGVGLRIGWAWIAPGPLRTRGRALVEAAREGMLVALGLVVVLLVSGLLEGYLTPSSLPMLLKDLIGVVVWAAFLAYVVVLGRAAELAGVSTDLPEELTEASVPVA
ncbi:stage II sporulation protein M [Dactylosporangium sp. NPDC005555]|uniref:stage II sporulation protein M n=1 Tax=Dactylosporangium sp. NPDC005555 TaxID=3154889 RepID=UPI0033A8B1B0